ncbi:MAG: lysophospholipid acyltransferase family protein [Fermentimonas sp.]|jgi:KDO2-lipid IV(A) lauroyltransferase|nr:lysophospholipid acyltransferase family protein [Fermentimonas sp.]MDD4697193.1 lysophospholipid acyltransferase family protein [Fermentimonas sp.]
MDDGERNKKSIGYKLLYGVTYLHALLPFSVLYLISDILYLLIYYVVRYRRKLVRRNIKNSFPCESEKKIIRIEKDFYRHLCDYFVETIKTLHISDEEVQKRMKFENPEMINRLTASGNSCILSLGHYANWEWVTTLGFHLSPGVKQGLVYKELHSNAFDKLFLEIRGRFQAIPIEMNSLYRKLIESRNNGERVVVGFLTDQRPPKSTGHYWTTFMNQDAVVQTGMERIAKLLSFSIVYLDITKVKRGYYVGKFYVITPDASNEPEFEIMERYINKLEETIKKEPAYYLWSHNRWKFKKYPVEKQS